MTNHFIFTAKTVPNEKLRLKLITTGINWRYTRDAQTVVRIRQSISSIAYPTGRRDSIQTEIKILVFAVKIMGVHKNRVLFVSIHIIVRPRRKNGVCKHIIISKLAIVIGGVNGVEDEVIAPVMTLL